MCKRLIGKYRPQSDLASENIPTKCVPKLIAKVAALSFTPQLPSKEEVLENSQTSSSTQSYS